MSDLLLILFGLALTVGTGLFVASEFSLVALDRNELEQRRAQGEAGLDRVITGLTKTSTHLSSAQLGITLTTLLTGYTFEPALSRLLDAPLAALGVPGDMRRLISAPIAIVVATLLSMIVGELVPKNYALARPLSAARLVMPFQALFTAVFRPAVLLLNNSANGVLRWVGIEPKEELNAARNAEELTSLVRRSASAGLLEQDTATLLGRTLRFSEHTAGDVMTPRMRVETVQKLAPAQAVIELSIRSGLSRFPVYDDDQDDITGVVHVKQAISVPRAKRADVPVAALQEDALRVPETMRLDQLLGDLRGAGFQLAIVVDEYGGTAGIVTLEDLVEELVGEVADEHDRARAGVIGGADVFTFPASLRPDEALEQTGIQVPDDGPYDTVAGYVMSELGRLPALGDEVAIDAGTLTVARMDGRRIDRLRFVATPQAVNADDE